MGIELKLFDNLKDLTVYTTKSYGILVLWKATNL